MVISALASLIAILALAWILGTVIARGAKSIDWTFFTQRPPGPGEQAGGVGPAIAGTLIITAMTTLLGVPIGLLTGVYLAEFGRRSRLAAVVRFAANVLMGTPSIIVGIFVYTIIVLRFGYSAYAGAVALAIIMLPVVGRTAEDIITLVPSSLRESALALGAPRWKVTLQIVFRAAKPGLITGVLLAIARVSGETAPLLFTALNSQFWPEKLNAPTPNLTMTIYQFAMSPFDNWVRLAWGASLLITMSVLAINIIARISFRGKRAA